MVEILYPLTADAAAQLAGDYPAIAKALGDEARAGRYPRQIHRLLDARYARGKCLSTLALVEEACARREPAGLKVVGQSDGLGFLGDMSELRAWKYLRSLGLNARTQRQGTSGPDILVKDSQPTLAIEVYSPIRPLGVKQLEMLLGDSLMYVDADRCYRLDLRVGPADGNPMNVAWILELAEDHEFRQWEESFIGSLLPWLAASGVGDERTFTGLGKASVSVRVLAVGPGDSLNFTWSGASHSVRGWEDRFEMQPAALLSQTALAKKLGQKLARGQARHVDADVRMLIVDLAHLDAPTGPANGTHQRQRTIGEVVEIVVRSRSAPVGPIVWLVDVPADQKERVERMVGLVD